MAGMCATEACDTQVSMIKKIKTKFSDAAQVEFNKRRYGIKSCIITEDFMYLSDLMELYKRSIELDSCPTQISLHSCCTLNIIEETIKTL